MREHDIQSADGTGIRVWHAGRDGPDVLLCPGLGTMPEAWPLLMRSTPDPDPARRVRVHSWYHRGILGSRRPADPCRIRRRDHVADALAVLDDAGIDSAVVMGWSVGVGVAAELAARFPERVAGLLLVAGTLGDPFAGILGQFGVPPEAGRLLGTTAARLVRDAGPLVNAVVRRVPVNAATATLVRHTGLMRPASRTGDVVRAGRRFLTNDWGWYCRLALALAEDPEPDLTAVRCPVTVLAGRYDLIADPKRVARSVGALPQARIRMLPTSHFLPFEAPDELAAELALLVGRAEAVRESRWAAAPRHLPADLPEMAGAGG